MGCLARQYDGFCQQLVLLQLLVRYKPVKVDQLFIKLHLYGVSVFSEKRHRVLGGWEIQREKSDVGLEDRLLVVADIDQDGVTLLESLVRLRHCET